MKNYYLGFLLFGFICNAQIGVGTTSPNSKSVLDLTSTTKGLLPPRMNNAQKNAIITPPAGLQVWCSDCSAFGEMQVYNGLYWTNMIGNEASNTVVVPTVVTTSVSSIMGTTAVSGGNVTSDGYTAITSKGVCWSTTAVPTIADSKTNETGTTSVYISNLTGLIPNILYYLRSYATNSVGTSYGEQVVFTTVYLLPTITTTAVTNITLNSATLGGIVTFEGGTNVTEKGVCWSSTNLPTTYVNKIISTEITNTFSNSITGLSQGVKYYIRAYAINSQGISYGAEVFFTTFSLPTVTSTNVTAITATTATSGGNVSSDGASAITERGLCWSTNIAPTIADNKIISVGTTGTYTSNITGLSQSTAYYCRAYATNSFGTSYGNENYFSTWTLPSLSTTVVTAILDTKATSGGSVYSDGGSAITSRGVCWSTTSNPTTANSTSLVSGTTGAFTNNLSGLSAGTRYYLRAFATNSVGTSYGSQENFLTFMVTAICDGTVPTTVVELTSSTGNVWMDRDLGASRVAQSSLDFMAYGCSYQWGRGNDGHANINYNNYNVGAPVNGLTSTYSDTDTPGTSLFIYITAYPNDWRSSQNNALWSTSGTTNNNPCPAGFRIPTEAQLNLEFSTYSIINSSTAFSNGPNGGFKFVLSGTRSTTYLYNTSITAHYWTSTVNGIYANSKYIYTYIQTEGLTRGNTASIRCIKG